MIEKNWEEEDQRGEKQRSRREEEGIKKIGTGEGETEEKDVGEGGGERRSNRGVCCAGIYSESDREKGERDKV